jgi:hypothetical protein
MTTLYTSNDLSTGLDATGTLPTGFFQGSGTWGVSTTNLLNGHTKSLQCTSAQDGQFAVFAGATASTDMDYQFTQKYNGVGTALGAIVRSDSTFTNGYLVLVVSTSSTAGSLFWFKKVAGTITGIAGTQAYTIGANTAFNLRVQIIGTTLRAKIWPSGSSEPAAFTGSVTDSSVSTGSYAGFYAAQNSGTSNGTVNAATDIVVSNGFTNSVTVDQPATQTAGASFTVTGTYQGTAPTAMDYIFNAGTFGTATAFTSFTASAGTWSGTATAPGTAGETFITVQDHNNATHTASSAAFTLTAAPTITITTPGSQVTSTAFTVSGTYTGTAPTGIDWQVNGGGFTAFVSPTIGGGTWSGSIPATAITSAGSYTIGVREEPSTTVTATSGSFAVGAGSITVTTPSGLLIAGQNVTLSGTYTGGAPTGINYNVDGGGYTALASPTIGGGTWSGTAVLPAFGQHTFGVQEANATSVVNTSGSFIVSVAPNDTHIVYSPYNWNVTAASAVTINAGAYFSVLFSGASCTLNFDVSAMVTPQSQIWYKVDNGPYTQATLSTSTLAVTIPAASTGNTDIPYHFLEVFVKSTTETGNRWNTGSNSTQVRFTGLTLAAGAAILATQKAPYNVIVYGDSITEGVRTLGESAANDTDRNDSGVCWSLQLAELLGAEVGVVGFGATALVANTGSGNVPTLPNSYNLLYQGVSRTFSPVPDLVVTNIGQNDGVTNTIATMTALLNSLLTACPTSKIAVMRPFSGNQAANLQAAIAACNSPFRVTYVDTTGFFNTAYGSDSLNVHPAGPNNIGLIAPQVAGLLKPILQNTSATYRGGFVRTA